MTTTSSNLEVGSSLQIVGNHFEIKRTGHEAAHCTVFCLFTVCELEEKIVWYTMSYHIILDSVR